ncbi:MAG: GTP 3',8-cyclase MoaA [Oscillospiraceae bacterium]|nr:GTP 3',8-cyclase MoaA [Oscillospiraceae bacterium]
MKDQYGREITYLRLSVTDLCNLRCVYCMPERGVEKLSHSDILSVEEIGELAQAAAELGITKLRLTGGEPLVRHGILDICRLVAQTSGIAETCLTTNGTLLTKSASASLNYAEALRECGVSRLNISLDTLDPERYAKLTRGGELKTALDGIEAARAAGFADIKINTVLISGVNEAEIRKLVELTRGTETRGELHVRFIEMMPIGEAAEWASERFLENSAVLRAVTELAPVGLDGVARLYRLPGATGTVGLISPISSHFCPDCNRVRVTSDGKLKPCLHSADEIPLRGLHGDDLLQAMRAAIFGKPQRHALGGKAISKSTRSMNAIGG